jgi:hypothetical protein
MPERVTPIHWIFSWAEAVERQRERIMTAPSLVTAQPDVLLLAAAIGGVLKTAALELGAEHKAIADFEQQIPNGKAMRDIVSHLDEYALGEGRLQRQGKAGRLVTLMRDGTGEIEMNMFGFKLEVNRAAEAVASLAAAVLDARN